MTVKRSFKKALNPQGQGEQKRMQCHQNFGSWKADERVVTGN